MKKILLVVLGLIGLSAGTYMALPVKPAHCDNCQPGRHCLTDFDCNSAMCNLSCVSIDRMGLDKRCR